MAEVVVRKNIVTRQMKGNNITDIWPRKEFLGSVKIREREIKQQYNKMEAVKFKILDFKMHYFIR